MITDKDNAPHKILNNNTQISAGLFSAQKCKTIEQCQAITIAKHDTPWNVSIENNGKVRVVFSRYVSPWKE